MYLIRQRRHKLFFAYAIFFGFFSLAPLRNAHAASEAGICTSVISTTDPTPLNEEARTLLNALAGQPADEIRRMAILKNALSSTHDDTLSSSLTERARLIYAAWQISQGKFEGGRRILVAMPQESDLAAKAALLIAESWRLEGNNEKSLQWFLRISKHYAGNIDALSGLLSAGKDLEEEQRFNDAYSLYEHVIASATTSERLVADISTRREQGLDVLHTPVTGPAQQIQQQITQRMLMSSTLPTSLARTDRAARQARQQLQCLLSRTRHYQIERNALLATLSEAEQNIAALDQMLVRQQADIDTLTSELIANDFSEKQLQLRRQLSQLRNQHAMDTATQEALRSNRDNLPRVIEKMDHQLATLSLYYQRAATNADSQLGELFQQSCLQLRQAFLNLAGDAALRSAELKQRHLSHPEAFHSSTD